MSINTSPARTLKIRSGQGDYVVRVSQDLEPLTQLAQQPNTVFLVDERVPRLHAGLQAILPEGRTFRIAAIEDNKTLQGVESVCLFLQKCGASKSTILVVIGGGITQDVGTFAAHLYYRGIPMVFVPTTLLSMADSCIGAKCGVNLGSYKNQLGFFQSPREVLISPTFLETLDPEDVRSGFGEIVKLAITDSLAQYEGIEARLASGGFTLADVEGPIFDALETKRRVIEQDEYEATLRKTLNYGHTFGHALESLTHHEVPHGIAVAWGIDVANYIGYRLGLLSETDFERVHHLLLSHFSKTVRKAYDAASLIQTMRRDKKAAGDSIVLVLPDAIGSLSLVPSKLDDELQALLADYLASKDIFSSS